MLGSGFRGNKKACKADWVLRNANNCNGFMAQHIWYSDKSDFDFEMEYYGIFDYNNIVKADSKRIKTKM